MVWGSITDYSTAVFQGPFGKVTVLTDSAFPRQIEGEDAARAGGTFHFDVTALSGGDLPGQIQPNAHPFGLVGRRSAIKSAENFGLLCLGMPGPVSRTQTAVNIS